MQILHDVFATGLQIGNEGSLVADPLEVFESQIDTHRPVANGRFSEVVLT
jgi:hypothetical protein